MSSRTRRTARSQRTDRAAVLAGLLAALCGSLLGLAAAQARGSADPPLSPKQAGQQTEGQSRAGESQDTSSQLQAGQGEEWDSEEPEAEGFGALEVTLADGETQSLELRAVRVQLFPRGGVMECHVEHVFHNPSPELLEGSFRFPLPEGASVLGLAMDVGGRMMEGELVERQKAKRIYQDVVDSMRDPAILEWEEGRRFKLRVFPIPPKSDKRVVIRFLADLERGPEGARFRYATSAPALQEAIASLRVELDGEVLLDERGYQAGPAIEVPLSGLRRPPEVQEELQGAWRYTAVELEGQRLLDALQGEGEPGGGDAAPSSELRARDLVVVFDRSRSTLESASLARRALSHLLTSLSDGDRFVVLVSDVSVRPSPGGLVPAVPEAYRRALDFVDGIRPDGASDLGGALQAAGALVRDRGDRSRSAQLVYIGDGQATWGETDPAQLRTLTLEALEASPLHAMLLGRSTDLSLMRALVAQQGGRLVSRRRPRALRDFVASLAGFRSAAILRNLQLSVPGADSVLPGHPLSLAIDERATALLRSEASSPAPGRVNFTASLGEREVQGSLELGPAQEVARVRHRWASARLAKMRLGRVKKEEQVAFSIEHGVLSQHTAFLVLESEDAYEKHAIERRKARERARLDPRVTGADLESADGSRPRLSPDHIQPGDPEIRIPAPEDAQAVTVFFPFGETKVARWEPELRAWTVRFLIDDSTPDGSYWVQVRITHADGSVELLRLPYVVDTLAPRVRLSLLPVPRRPGLWRIRAQQRITTAELDQMTPRWRSKCRSKRQAKRRYAHILTDVKRVDVSLPNGEVLELRPRPGHRFEGLWRPELPLEGRVELGVVSVDGAWNARRAAMSVCPRGFECE